MGIFFKFGELGGSPTSCAQKLLQKPKRSREQCAHKPIKPREQCAHKPIKPLRGPAPWLVFYFFLRSSIAGFLRGTLLLMKTLIPPFTILTHFSWQGLFAVFVSSRPNLFWEPPSSTFSALAFPQLLMLARRHFDIPEVRVRFVYHEPNSLVPFFIIT